MFAAAVHDRARTGCMLCRRVWRCGVGAVRRAFFFLWGYKSNLSDPVHGHKSILLGSRWKILETLLDHGRVLETLLGHNKKEKRTFVISQRRSPSSRAARVARRAFVLAAHGMGLPCSSMWKDSTQRYKKSCAYTCATIYKLQRAETRREHYREP